MALSVKFALLTCLLFTGGMCWVVNQVGRSNSPPGLFHASTHPNRSTPVSESPPAHSPVSVTTERDVARSGRLERQSPVLNSQLIGTAPENIVEAEPSPEIVGDVRVPPPPLGKSLLEMRTAAQDSLEEVESADGQPRQPEIAQAFGDYAADRKVQDNLPARSEPSGALQSSTIYTVKKGDSLYKVCREFYGDKQAEGIQLVLMENPKVAARRGKMLHLGEMLQIPPLEGADGMVLDAGGMEGSDSNTVRVLPNPDIPEAVQEDSQTREPPAPKLTQSTTKKSPPKKAPSSPTPREERPKARPSSPKPMPPATKLAMAKNTSAKPRGASAADGVKKTTGKTSGTKATTKTGATRKNAAAAPSKSTPEKRSANPAKKNARRASVQEALERELPATLVMAE